jgi:hypothetical protein
MLGEDFSISITQLAIPAVSALIAFLAYTSQYFFLHFESVPLTRDEICKINIFALCIWICYYRTCFVDPGRLPKAEERPKPKEQEGDGLGGRQRWCLRCEAYKPPRAHHCKTCKRFDGECLVWRILLIFFQMHSQNGSSLPLDLELRLPFYPPTFHALFVLCDCWDVLPGDSSLAACLICMEEQPSAKRK